ncbi:YbaB/EbfC family nucleoid-associated protein [Stackebrandtia soli]|uniref:YbaB/EbfC family nucleoid-associated protein n=1 Tax=Stackebrandtia soli TaxID=1892856 RepID=UPI0039E750D8
MSENQAASDQIDEMDRRMRHQAEQAQRLQEAVSRIEAKAANASGTIKVRVDASGALTGLRLEPAALEAGHEKLAEEILKGCQAARTMLAGKVHAAADEVLGEGSQTGQVIANTYAQRFGAPLKSKED